MSVITKDLGMVTAYAYAVSKGYTGTEEEFATLMASYATVAEEAAASAATATEQAGVATQKAVDAALSASNAEGSATTASTKAGEASQSATSAAGSATTAGTKATEAGQSATAAAGSATTAGTKATEASASATAAANAQTAAEAAQTRAETAQEAAETAQTAAEASAEAAAQSAASLTVDDEMSDSSTNPVQNKAITEALETKAENDGYYESLTAGQAEQLVSTVGIEDKVPYNFRTAGGSADIGDRLTEKIVGGTVAWNQLAAENAGVTNSCRKQYDISTKTYTLTITNFASNSVGMYGFNGVGIISGHKYICSADCKADFNVKIRVGLGNNYAVKPVSAGAYTKIQTVSLGGTKSSIVYASVGESGAEEGLLYVKNIQLHDLTQMFGSTIADYIYSLEQANAGAGVAWFRHLFPKPYYEYNAGELMSVQATSHKTVGFNAYNPTTGTAQLVGGMQYQITGAYTALSLNGETITPDASGYFTPSANGTLTVTGGNSTDTCVHLVWDGERDGEYEPYELHSYPLDSDLVLRGIPKLDSNNELYYDGDEYESDGAVTRKYGIVDLGTLNWYYQSSSATPRFYAGIGHVASDTGSYWYNNILCPKYRASINIGQSAGQDKVIGVTKGVTSNSVAYVCDSAYTDLETFKAAMSGVYLLFPYATPTEETADPFQSPQIVNDFGTEEYVDAGTRDVAIPVGHVTQYQNNLRAKLEMAPDSPDGDGIWVVKQTNGENAYIPLVIPAELPTNPSNDGTYVLKATVTNGTTVLSWEAQA